MPRQDAFGAILAVCLVLPSANVPTSTTRSYGSTQHFPAFCFVACLVSSPPGWLYILQKRFDSILRSPIFSHFSETLTGQVTIRAFGLVRQFAATNADRVASSVSAWYTLKSTDRWLSVRLEGLGVLIILVAALLAVGTGSSRASATSSASASETASALAGFSLSYAMAVTGLFSWLLRTYAETEQLMNSVERIAHYIDTTPQEPYEQPAG